MLVDFCQKKGAFYKRIDLIPKRRQDRRLEDMSLHLQKVLSSKYYVTPDSDLTIEQQKAITILRDITTRAKELTEPKYAPLPTEKCYKNP